MTYLGTYEYQLTNMLNKFHKSINTNYVKIN